MKRIIALLLAVVMLISLVGCTSKEDKKTETANDKYVVYTENYGFTEGEMAYLYNYVYNQYASYLTQLGVDTEKSLKEQIYQDDQSWFDYLMEQAVFYAEDFLLFCEEGNKRGIALDDADLENIKTELANIETAAKEAGFKSADDYLIETFGKGLTVGAYEGFMTKSALASKSYSAIIGGYTFDQAAIEAHYASNENSFKYIDYLSFTFQVNEEKAITAEIAEANANLLAESTTEESFLKAAEAYILANATEEEKATLDMTAQLGYLTTVAGAYTAEDAFSEWAYGAEAQVGQTFIDKDVENGIFTVYLLTKAPYRNESTTVDVRHILLTPTTYTTDEATLAKAEEVLAEWKAGEATAESFGALAEQYTEDSGSKATGGLYAGVAQGEMVAEFNDWIFDTARAEGDSGIVKTDYGYHIMYFVGKGGQIWISEVENALKQQAYNTDYTAFKEAYAITVDQESLDKIED